MGKVYAVKELFYTLQGEGAQAGRAAVFCRFAGCNLWSGREADRASAICRFCDTDFVGTDGPGGGRFTSADELAEAVAQAWSASSHETALARRYVVCTGGEPLLQLDSAVVAALRGRGFEVAVETNGTRPLPAGGVDWVCVSPKGATEIVVREGDELKLVYPQVEVTPAAFAPPEYQFRHWFLQPCEVAGDRAASDAHTAAALEYCLYHPRWRLSLQTHKLLGIP